MVKVLILSATGNQGSATLRALQASKQKHSIRALVRDASSEKAKALVAQGVEVLEGGDWDKDVASLEKAVAGIEAVFFISNFFPGDTETEVRGATNIIEAAKRSGTVNHVIYSTVGGIDYYKELPGLDTIPFFLNYWESKTKGEELVRTGGFAYYTLLRPVEFMSNWTVAKMAGFQYPDLIKDGVLHTAFPESQIMAEISPDDIGRTAAAAIEAPGTFAGGPTRELHLAGELLALKDIVAQLSEVTGKKLSVYTYSDEEAVEAAKTNLLIAGQISRRDWKGMARPAEDFGLGFSTFREYLEKHREEVRELYKNVP
ncbi:NAD(P)-binding protein [Annulohypoxylon maeteangense]|uniref:NAD(P)-binding protein n=1 Tax=Annulohypoxylon maeteangense TaxID=1927788 RepID=UPI00200838F7|nr:NAD(P)-binding protein [Annulohypoxylon maeteangense]KAI0883362.1 NAD(P)-binding protein [Annulohypoxylon maeteangense]